MQYTTGMSDCPQENTDLCPEWHILSTSLLSQEFPVFQSSVDLSATFTLGNLLLRNIL
jgi:hypothetical protein